MNKYTGGVIGLVGVCVGIAGFVAAGESKTLVGSESEISKKSEFDMKFDALMVQRDSVNDGEVKVEKTDKATSIKRVVFKDKYGNFRLCSGECGACGVCL